MKIPKICTRKTVYFSDMYNIIWGFAELERITEEHVHKLNIGPIKESIAVKQKINDEVLFIALEPVRSRHNNYPSVL